MKRFKIIGLCLVAAFALSAIAASGASAAVEGLYGTCLPGTPVNNPPCGSGEHFTAFSGAEMVLSHGTTTFVLINEKATEGVECTSLLDSGTYRNGENEKKEMLGLSTDTLAFGGCKPKTIPGCKEVNVKTNHEISGTITDETVKKGKAVKVTIASGFEIICAFEGAEFSLGKVKGSAEGAVNGDLLVFTAAKGLEFFEEKANITGTNLTETLGGMPVVVG
jgi:hypothetical protein